MLFFQDSVTLAALLAAADVEIEILPQPTSANSSSTITNQRTSVASFCFSLLISELKTKQMVTFLDLRSENHEVIEAH